MSGHTRGPWQVIERRLPHYLGSEHKARMIFTAWDDPQLKGPYPVVCTSIGIPEHKGDPAIHFCGISEADARLIAQSPRLLTALQNLVSWRDNGGHNGDESWNWAREVIAHATQPAGSSDVGEGS